MRPRKVLRIARWEVSKGLGAVDRRTALAGGTVLLAVLVLAPVAAPTLSLDRGLYRAGVPADNPYHDVLAEDPTFTVHDPDRAAYERGDLEVLVAGDRVFYHDTDKGRAAVAELRRTVEQYNDRRLRDEANQSAAFPVYPVDVRYVERGEFGAVAPAGSGGGGGDGDGGTGTGGAGGADGADGGQIAAPGFGGDLFGTGTSSGAPSDIAPPFPFQSLVLAFLFVVPLNFVIQVYGSSVLGERIDRRGELLLVSPVTRGEIIAGKTAPYFAVTLAIAAVIAVAVGGGALSVLAVVPIAALFLAATFVGAMFARSFKELTFVTVAVSVTLTTFAFVPAIFTDVGPVALISPLTLVVRDLSGAGVTPGEAVFSTLPATLTALVLFVFGAGVYREEDMFTQRSIHLKALDALAGRVARPRSLALVVAMLVPFVFVAELLAVAVLFVLPVAVSVPLVFAVVAVVEEFAKSLPTYAGFTHARYDRSARTALVAGGFAGLGFFLAEKLTLVVQLVGLPELRAGSAAFPGATVGGVAALALLVAPLALHVVTAAVSGLGASRGRRGYLVGLVAAILLHVAYNLTVVSTLA